MGGYDSEAAASVRCACWLVRLAAPRCGAGEAVQGNAAATLRISTRLQRTQPYATDQPGASS